MSEVLAGPDTVLEITDDARFEVASDVVATDFEGKDAVVLNLATKKYYTLNETATAIWGGIEAKREVRELIDELVSNFDVTTERARPAVLGTLENLRGQELVRLCPRPE